MKYENDNLNTNLTRTVIIIPILILFTHPSHPFCISGGSSRKYLGGPGPSASRGAEGAEWGGVWGGGIPLPSRLGGLGERRKLPQRGPGRSPGRKRFSCVLRALERLSLQCPPQILGSWKRPLLHFTSLKMTTILHHCCHFKTSKM